MKQALRLVCALVPVRGWCSTDFYSSSCMMIVASMPQCTNTEPSENESPYHPTVYNTASTATTTAAPQDGGIHNRSKYNTTIISHHVKLPGFDIAAEVSDLADDFGSCAATISGNVEPDRRTRKPT